MKLYCQSANQRHYLENHFGERVTFVDTKGAADYLITGTFNKDDLHPALKGVIIPYTGYDRIDIQTMRDHQLKLFHTTVHSKFVAEKAVQLMFALLGNVVNYHNRLKEGDWGHRNSTERTPWVSVFDRKIGIYGYGRIGRLIHEMLKPFNVDVFVIDRQKTYPDATPVKDLETMISNTEIVFVTTPLSDETEHAFDTAMFKHMQDRYLINVGRGRIIAEAALYEALKTGILKGFASDVWYDYPQRDEKKLPSTYPIHTFEHVVLSPHCGGFSTSAPDVMMVKVKDHIENIMKGRFEEALDLHRL